MQAPTRPRPPTGNGAVPASAAVEPRTAGRGGPLIKTAADLASESTSFAIAGRYASGKTSTMVTVLDWPKIKKPKMFVMDSEGGLKPVRSRGSAIDYSSITSYEETDKVLGWLETGGAKDYGALGMDNVSEIADLSMEEVLSDADKEEPEWGEWRLNSRKVATRVVRRFRNIGRKYGIPVIFTFWDREETLDEKSKKVIAVHADLNQKLRSLTLAAVDYAFWIEILSNDPAGGRAMHLTASKRTDAKSRLDPAIPADRSIPRHVYSAETISLVPYLEAVLEGKMWPDPNPYAFPEGILPRWERAPKLEEPPRTAREVRKPRPTT